jgi:hypothetical protein
MQPITSSRKKKPSRTALVKLFRLFKQQWGSAWMSRFKDDKDFDTCIEVWQRTLAGYADKVILAAFWRIKPGYPTWPPTSDQFRDFIRTGHFFVAEKEPEPVKKSDPAIAAAHLATMRKISS